MGGEQGEFDNKPSDCSAYLGNADYITTLKKTAAGRQFSDNHPYVLYICVIYVLYICVIFGH